MDTPDNDVSDGPAPIPAAAPAAPKIWSLVALMDYLLHDLAPVSPMSAHLLRMARQNLLDEVLGKADLPPPPKSED